jgi:diguanylate cyclase (GGDEF)-like protein
MAIATPALWFDLTTYLALPVSGMTWAGMPGGHIVIIGSGLLAMSIILSAFLLTTIVLFWFRLRDDLVYMSAEDLPPRGDLAAGTSSLQDRLTGFPGRLVLEGRLRRLGQERAALLVIGIDGFRMVNEAFGHAAGDALLREVAGRVNAAVRGEDAVFRLEGDEFAVLTRAEEAEQVVAIARRLLLRLQRPFRIGSQEIRITASIGAAIELPGDHNRRKLLANAGVALRHAKDMGRNRYSLFEASMQADAIEIDLMIGDLQKALHEEQLFLCYQPKLDLGTGGISGVEALLRWNHPVHGAISPDQFIPLAEKTGMINEIGAWTLNQACRQMQHWRSESVNIHNVAVNISVFQLTSPYFFDTVRVALERHGLEPADLMLEITESAAMRNPELTLMVLRKLTSLGVAISLDDFGVGHSSLTHLKQLPVCELKIDRSFIRDIENDPEDMAIVSAVVSLAKAVDLKVVAEGVETAGQQALLTEVGCDVVQGYLIGRPGSPRDVAAIVSAYDVNRRQFETSFTL